MPTFETSNPILATVDLSIGDVRITAGDEPTTTVEVRPSDSSNEEDVKVAGQTRVEFADGQLLVKSPRLRSWLSRRGGSIELTIELPAGSDVHGAIGLGDFDAAGRLGDCRMKTGLGRIQLGRAGTLDLKTGAGDVTVDHATGHSEVTTGTGDIRLGRLEAGAVVKNSNGYTSVAEAGGELRLSSANGDISVGVAAAGMAVRSSNGDVRVREAARGSVVLEAKIGDVEVGIPEGVAAWLDVSSKYGHVRNSLEATEAPGASAETVEVRAHTSVGEVVIRRP